MLFAENSNSSGAETKLITCSFAGGLDTHHASQLRQAEIRWHYSQHFLAEKRGEEVIENMLQFSLNKKQRALLTAQLVDEKIHTDIFSKQVSRIGLEDRASRYADGYAALVKAQKTFAEKIFVFQILTEAISAAYCDWRMDYIKDERLNSVDAEVAADEKRHLVMGSTLLAMCETEELNAHLDENRQRELIKEMNALCEKTVRQDMLRTLLDQKMTNNEMLALPTSLDRYVARAVIQEYRKLKKNILSSNLGA